MKTVLILGHDGMGSGDAELGQRILATFLRKSVSLRGFTAIAMFNSGVKLAAEGSPVLAELRQLHDGGVDVRPCGTCVDFYQLRDKMQVGSVSSMDEIVAELNAADKVIAL